ncbi:MAG: hypothetical protein JWN21_199 [Sphingomonas bacterium]|uniref:vanadium-dependent haloperoxidase n=1 Tax=Sphingomonas bacterium TaxID=1895847 RepID=UPI00260FE804|nr:vanadium-dependent haloperoxidase [Sphingomonas bacterium]MDB5694656.1 hypothetical protein [Sphingomonas bacterium]
MEIRLLAAAAALLASAPVRADVVIDWAEYAVKLEPGAGDAPEAGLASSKMAIAMFEAANAIDHRYASFLGMAAARRGASLDAAVIAAARDALVGCYPDKKARIVENAAFAIAALPDSAESKSAGEAVGAAAAVLALTHVGLDTTVIQKAYRPFTRPGTWVGASLPVFEPYNQALKPWVIGRIDAVRPGPPPALASDRYASHLNEVKRLGGRQSTERTAHQTLMARYRITPNLMPMMRYIADMPGRSTVQNARMLARQWIAEYDERLAMVDAKMHYNFWRPITAIRNAEDDGNPATVPDPGWLPFINTPNHPEYPCGHCGYAAVAATMLAAEVGDAPPGGVVVASESIPDAVVMRMPTFDDWVRQVSLSRTLGGVHYRFSNEAGEEIGRAVATRVLKIMRPLR